MKRRKHSGLSLTEVLVATGIIAVAVYGMIMSLTAQQLAEGRLRDRKLLTQLHQQLVREVLKNQRNSLVSGQLGLDTGGTDIGLSHPVLGNSLILNGQEDGNGNVVSTLTLTRDGNTATTSVIVTARPYAADWGSIRP